MATMTRAEMIDLALERLGVKAATVSARDEDATAAGVVLDSVFSRLRKEHGLPFAISAVEDWAQIALADVVAEELAPTYKITGEPLVLLKTNSTAGERKIARQMSGFKHPRRVRFQAY